MYLTPFTHAITAPANQINRINPFLILFSNTKMLRHRDFFLRTQISQNKGLSRLRS